MPTRRLMIVAMKFLVTDTHIIAEIFGNIPYKSHFLTGRTNIVASPEFQLKSIFFQTLSVK